MVSAPGPPALRRAGWGPALPAPAGSAEGPGETEPPPGAHPQRLPGPPEETFPRGRLEVGRPLRRELGQRKLRRGGRGGWLPMGMPTPPHLAFQGGGTPVGGGWENPALLSGQPLTAQIHGPSRATAATPSGLASPWRRPVLSPWLAASRPMSWSPSRSALCQHSWALSSLHQPRGCPAPLIRIANGSGVGSCPAPHTLGAQPLLPLWAFPAFGGPWGR